MSEASREQPTGIMWRGDLEGLEEAYCFTGKGKKDQLRHVPWVSLIGAWSTLRQEGGQVFHLHLGSPICLVTLPTCYLWKPASKRLACVSPNRRGRYPFLDSGNQTKLNPTQPNPTRTRPRHRSLFSEREYKIIRRRLCTSISGIIDR